MNKAYLVFNLLGCDFYKNIELYHTFNIRHIRYTYVGQALLSGMAPTFASFTSVFLNISRIVLASSCTLQQYSCRYNTRTFTGDFVLINLLLHNAI